MDLHHEDSLVQEERSVSFIGSFYDAVSAMKEGYASYLILLIFSFSLKSVSVLNANATDDLTVIFTALTIVIGNFIQGAFILNFFYFRFKGENLKISKVLWDIPTYIFYAIASSLLILLGLVFFIIPGIYLFYYYSNVAVTAILFDEEDKSNFKLTKKKVSKLGGSYAALILVAIVVSLITSAVVSLAPGAGIPVAITLIACLLLTFIQDILAGVVVSLFKNS